MTNDIEAAARAAFEKWWKAWEHVGTKKAIAWQTWRAARSVYEPTGDAALAHAARGERAPDLIEERCAIAKRVYLALGGEPENVETGNSLFQTVKAAVFADWYAPTPPPATGEAGTRGEVVRKMADAIYAVANHNVVSEVAALTFAEVALEAIHPDASREAALRDLRALPEAREGGG